MTTTPNADRATFDVPGWQRPAWAVEASIDQGHVSFTRTASVTPLATPGSPGDEPAPSEVYLLRGDVIHLDPDTGTMSIEQGQTVIWLDIEELSVVEARKLAAALIELADYAEGMRQ